MKDGSPLAWPAYRALWFANLTCNTGVLIQSVGAAWIMVSAGASPQLIALVQTAASLPLVLISPFSGALSDAVERRRLMIVSQGILAGASIALAALAWSGAAHPVAVLACIFLAGCGLALNGPAFMASVSQAVPRPVLPDAVVHNAIGLNIARTIGPAAGGILVAVAGALSAFVVNAIGAIALIAVLWKWAPAGRPSASDQSPGSGPRLLSSIAAGARYAMASPPIRAALFRTVVFGTAFSALQALMPLIARDLMGGGPTLFGLLSASFGAGALAGAWASGPLRRRFSAEAIVQLCSAASAAALLVVAHSPSAWLAAPCVALVGAAWVVAYSIFNVSVQLASPATIVGRTLSLYQMAVFTGIAAGSWLSGLAADHLGARVGLVTMGAVGLASLAARFVFAIAPLDVSVEAGRPERGVRRSG
jgi:predicted MFS family arabinose efflux permease